MSIIRVNEVDLNDDGNASVQIANSWNVALVTSSVIRLEARTDGSVVVPGALTANSMNVSGALTADALVPSSSFQRNRIINGAMDIWQRGTSFPNSGSTTYTADRFLPSLTGVLVNVTQDSSVPNNEFKYSLKMVPASNATATECVMRQWIEQSNLYDFTGKTVTASVWVNCSKSSVRFRVAAFNATNGGDGIVNVSVTPGVWTRITQSFTSFATVTAWTSTPNDRGAFFDVGFVNGTALTTSDYFFMTGAQVEVGTAATPFERRHFGQELMLCQRYYSKTYSYGVAPGNVSDIGRITVDVNGRLSTTNRYTITYPYMRASPTITVYNPGTGGSGTVRGDNSTNYSAGIYVAGDTAALIDFVPVSPTTAVFFHFTASAEF